MSDQDKQRGAPPSPASEQPDDRRTIARRKLLKMAYVAPVIVGTLLISQDAGAAEVTPSCPPYVDPCGPKPNASQIAMQAIVLVGLF